jgi:DNA-binding ferritin-like protein
MNDFILSFPIDMVKKEQRIVSGIATADNIDKSGDIVDFEASKEAFQNWSGNIREMHAPIAVGKAINYEPIQIKSDDGKVYNAFRVDAYISKGAQNTWEKVLDGTLRAFSIGGKILEKSETSEKMSNGRSINVIKKYILGELSLVDNPANALAVVDIVKRSDDGDLSYILDEELEKAKQPLKDPKGGLTAAGRRHFKQTEGANLKPGVKGAADTPEKMRRKGSFLTRFFTNPSGPMKDEKGRPTRLALSAAAWGEPVPQNAQDAAALAAKGRRLLERYAKVKKKSIDDLILEDEEILNKEMDYFINIDSEELIKDSTVTSSSMGAGIKNPTQGALVGEMPRKAKNRRSKKQMKIKKSLDAKPELIKALQNTLAHTVVLYFSAHRAHWNVQGPDFNEYHDLFGEIYEDTYGSVDPLAENIRKSGGFPQTLSEMEDAAMFEDASATTDARELATDLYQKNIHYIEMLKDAFNVANSINEQGIANFIAERIDMHQKWSWQLNASLGGVESIDVTTEEEEDEMEDDSEEMTSEDLISLLREAMSKVDNTEFVKMQDNSLQNDIKYDKVSNMNEQDAKLSLMKRFVNWLVPDVEQNASTISTVEVTENTQEEDMDIDVLKDALSAVVDEKLSAFATSIKEEVEASVQEKIDTITKGFEVSTSELQEKLQQAEETVAEQQEKINAFAQSGAIKKSVDPEDDDDAEGEELSKSSTSVWQNTYLPQGLINALGYKS